MEKGEIKMKTIPDEVWEKMQGDIAEIKTALLGNEYNPYGALHQIKEHEKTLVELTTRVNRMMWTAGAIGATAGFLISFILKLIPLFTV